MQSESCAEDADQIEVPANFVKADQSVNCMEDAWSLLHSLRYWIAGTDLPSSLVVFCLSPSGKSIPASFWKAFSAQFPHLDVLRRMTTSRVKDPSAKVLMAIETGDISFVRLVHEILKCLPGSACEDAARTGNLARLQYVSRNRSRKVVNACIAVGSLECLEYAIDQGYNIPADACSLAARLGRLSCLEHLCASQPFFDEEDVDISVAAARAGHLDCLQFAVAQGRLHGDLAMTAAMEGGHLECMHFLHAQGVGWDEITCSVAASRDQLACLKYVHEHGCPWDARTCRDAAGASSLPCLQYAHEHGCPWGGTTTEAAAGKQDVSCLQYAHERGCPWDERTCQSAARAGSLRCLQYAHEHGCPWDTRTCELAVSYGRLPWLQYAHQHGCPWDVAAAWSPACKAYMHEHHCLLS
jgi:hypothetical protein